MARGLPAFWSSIIGVPFIGVGLFLYLAETNHPAELGIPFILFGIFIVGVGLYVHYIAAPKPPKLRENEELIDDRHPTQRVALAKILVSIPLLALALYLLFHTKEPYVYPTIAFITGLYFLSEGLQTYWTNSLTKYYITNQRIVKEYRLLSLIRREIPFGKVRAVEIRKSPTEAIVGLGNVRVASGEGGTLEIVMQNIENTTDFADKIRNLI
ncbi:PH domain-containing protein [Halorubellus salinus]|uniref:PH domain-containing protein n=1 Tax=Halorubellus salinus TaxID=755309 RepID=UPI001D082954|nr:PH domain-containing protein [Halorubellus salinus]